MTLKTRIKWLEQKLHRQRDGLFWHAEELTDEELERVICDSTGLQPEDLSDDVLETIAAGQVVGHVVGKEG